MSKFREKFGAVVRGFIVVLQTVAAVVIPAKFADAATRDDGAHKDAVASDEGLRFELDAKADEALAQAETYVQVAQAQRNAQDVVEEAVQVLSDRGVDVGALAEAGALGDAVQSLVESGDVEAPDVGDVDDVGDIADSFDAGDAEELVTSS